MLLLREIYPGAPFVDLATSGVRKHVAELSNPNSAEWEDITSIENWDLYGRYVGGKDHIWMQRRIAEQLQLKAGATDVDKWDNCTIDEKNIILKYNQFKGVPGGDEDTAKVTHLLTTGQASDVSDAARWLRHNHAVSVTKTRPAARARVEGDRIIEAIIKYLDPHDTDQLLSTMSAYLTGYKDYVLVGTVIPGNEPGLWDYINSTDIYGGPPASGLVEEGWVTQTGTLNDLRDALNDILFGDDETVL